MKVTIYTPEKANEYTLPNQISGSYMFGKDLNSEEKLVNIEAVDNNWVIKGHEDTLLIYDNKTVNERILKENDFYLLKNEDITYLLIATSSLETNFAIYSYNQVLDLIIGNAPECNMPYQFAYITGVVCEIKMINEQLVMNSNLSILSYINSERVNEQTTIINIGDVLNIFGLKIMFLKNTIIVNNPFNSIIINLASAGLANFQVKTDKYENKDVKEIDIYAKKDYFSKSPRIRRLIEEKELKIDPPPAEKEVEKMPLLLTAGPMLTMAATSGTTMLNTLIQISSGATTFAKSWPQIVTGVLMLASSLIWPNLTKTFNEHLAKEERKRVVKLYNKYLEEKEAELKKELVMQKTILDDNLIDSEGCIKIISSKKNNFWCKRVEQSDFLTARVGIGDVPLKINVDWPEEGFTIENDSLKEMAEQMIDQYKYINNCPLEYSFYENFLTAIMGIERKSYGLMDNILLQFMTFYCYDELKIVVFTNSEKAKRWDYLKYSNYCFSNDKNVRFFATNLDEARILSSYLGPELSYKTSIASEGNIPITELKPYYLIICDNYPAYKKLDFFKELVELDNNVGYSTIIIENELDKLPSKCFNFINLNEGSSGILKNSFEKAEIINFHDEINYNINMMGIIRNLSNIPVEIEGAAAKLPDAIEFLEMEQVGKVEQLNVLNRWNSNDSTKSLKAEVGVDEEGNLMYLDLHEKFHGPHGLIAGTTGSGKSEFIITYILSMSMNYSPEDVAFILIDYKGGGLAFAFENKLTGVKLPHLAGTITNLDKSEMNRTLVSIDSEVKRRQAKFNEARDQLGESTIDIYKYQNFYHEGKLKEPIPHLFLIADEFAELKSQQPDFMDNLISVARIGRSLGVHLILATQKPTGVVNEQIWSNTKFRVCLKVADASDSNEMIKKPDAALLKQSGRFYLQVGMDEIFELGQSGWAGAKYYPSDTIQKQIDRSINFIDNNGQVIKTIKEQGGDTKKEAQGEQLAAVMQEIIKVAGQTNKYAKRLWLDNVPQVILVDQVEQKYNITHTPYNVTAVIGEYDAPELQEQGIVLYDFLENGNTVIYGTDGSEREQLLNAIIYSACKHHTASEINFYTVDYGSESLRMFAALPHFGGMVFDGETEKYTNLIKMINEETAKRKKLFVDFGGDYVNYIKNSGNKLPLKVIIFNNYDTAKESIESIYEEMPELLRDSARYGIIYILTANGLGSTPSKVTQNITNTYALRLKDSYEYGDTLNGKTKQTPQDTPGRGMLNNDGIHEFQTAFIVEDVGELNSYIIEFINQIKATKPPYAQRIPTLPDHVRIDDIREKLTTIESVPIGIIKENLDVLTIDYHANVGNIVSSNKIANTINYVKSLISVFKELKIGTILIDGVKALETEKANTSNYFNDNFEEVIKKLDEYVEQRISTNNETPVAIMIYGLDKFVKKLDNNKSLEEFFDKCKKHEKIPIIIVEEAGKIKEYQFDSWYKSIFNVTNGLWIGSGASDQSLFKISSYNKEYSLEYNNDIGFYIEDGFAKIVKLIDFVSEDGSDINEE